MTANNLLTIDKKSCSGSVCLHAPASELIQVNCVPATDICEAIRAQGKSETDCSPAHTYLMKAFHMKS
jgi:hypothetical protein